jgi:mannose-6-phosphate isomerase
MLYPLKFEPILKDKIWGGTRLKSIFGKASSSKNLGESWELSGVENDESVVSNGILAGNTLSELTEIYRKELVGDKVFSKYGFTFPLLFKLIDANDNLSIQVHPNDEVAAQRHNSYGKTEMWYVLDAKVGAELIIGFSKDCTQKEYLDALNSGRVEELLQKVLVKKGDVFFIPAGLVHAIGRDIVIAEIQQTSDITYRIYDYNRTDDNGNERELHTEQALDVIQFAASKNPYTHYSSQTNEITNLVSCNYFTTNLLNFDKPISRNYASLDSFVVYMCLDGTFLLSYGSEVLTVNKGETALVPASIADVKLIPQQQASLLEVFVGE